MTRKQFGIIIELNLCTGVRQVMKQVVDRLREKEYVSAANVEALRKYIRLKNPEGSAEELSAVFADALHKIIDTRIYQFEEKHRKKIKDDVLRKAVKKKEFSINAAAVFSSCLSLKLHGDNYVDSFNQWINQNQPVPVPAEKVDKLVSSIELLEEDYIENNLDEIIDGFEANRAEDKSLTVPGLEVNEASMPQTCRKAHRLKYIKPSVKPAVLAAIPLAIIVAFVLSGLLSDNTIKALRHPDQGKYADISEEQIDRYMSLESKVQKKLGSFGGKKALVLLDGLQSGLKYEEVDGKKLKRWLENKNSLLTEEPYFTAILETARQYDIHPLLMFAIVGQEQAFVPKNYASAEKIANNPFNVYGSWEKYNTDIYDSSRLAADTIIKSSRNRPVYMNAIRWINRRYAEDPNWWNGVSELFNQMKKDILP